MRLDFFISKVSVIEQTNHVKYGDIHQLCDEIDYCSNKDSKIQ